MPPTDSGYATVPPEGCASEGREPGGDDSGTVVSAETRAIGPEAQRPISEVCNDIYNQIQKHVDKDNQASVLDVLPTLIKAFAVRLANRDPTPTGRQLMHFVYSRNIEIASHLRQLFQPESEANDPSRLRNVDGMSVAEKMRLWSSKPDGDDPSPIPKDAFQGVEDLDMDTDTDGIASPPEVSAYSRAILESEEYQWLIQHLLKESSFHWGPGPRIMVDEIRHSIMNGLPSGRISKRLDPPVHRVEFRISWPPLRRRILRERNKRRLGSSGDWDTISSTVVVVGSSDGSALVTTVREYMDRTWGSHAELLGKFIAAVGNPNLIGTASQAVVPDTVSVFVRGVSHTIAEQGQQLAWLVAALCDSEGKGITYSKPSISKRDTDVWEVWAESTAPTSSTGGISTLKQLGWLGEGIPPVIAQGFPTFRHPSPSSAMSLEVSQMVMIYWRPLHLAERGPALELVSQRKDSMRLWHAPVTSPCRCTGDARMPGTDSEPRHFVAVCRSSVFEDMPGSTTPRTVCEPQAQERDVPGSLSTAMAASSKGSTPSSTKTPMDSDMLSVPDSLEAPLRDIPDQLSAIINTVAARLLYEYRTGTWRRTSLAPGTPDPESNPELCPLDTDNGALGAASVRTRPQSQGGGQQQDAGYVGCHTSSSAGNDNPRTSSGPSRKRAARDLDGYEDDDDRQGDMPPPKKAARGPCPPAEKPLACPYWKLDPRRYRDCGKRGMFREIKHVKQHLYRNHCMPDIYCSRCKVKFPDRAELEHHSQHAGAACLFKPLDPEDPLITGSQKTKLQKKSPATRSVYDRWYDVWKIVFGSRPPPSSPYLDTGITASFCDFREYARGRGRQILLEALVAAGFQALSTSLSEETRELYTRAAVSRVLEAVIDDFLSAEPAVNPVRSSTPSGRGSASKVSERTTNVSGFADSGISVRRQLPVPHHSPQDASLT
ncbi:hypothetical protein C8A05DRAFT_20226, partial [Staphylotrichum tortipilum]